MAREKILAELADRLPGQFDPEAVEAPYFNPTSLTRETVFVHRRSKQKPVAETRTTLEIPEIIDDPIPLLWVPGYGGIKPAYRRVREGSAQHARQSVTWRPIRDMSFLETLCLSNVTHPEQLPVETLQAVIDYACEATEEEQVDLACHSMGGYIAAKTAALESDRIRQIILVASAGLEDHSLVTLAKRAPGFFMREFIPHFKSLREENEARMALEALDYFLRNPFRTMAEGIAVANCDIRGDLMRIRDAGVMIGGLLFASDELFIEQNVRDQSGDLFDILETYDDLEVGHMGPQLFAVGVAREVVDQSRRLELARQTIGNTVLHTV